MNTLFRILLLLHLSSSLMQAQCYPLPTILNPAAPNPCKLNRTAKPFAVPYPSLREADVMWSKRTWRVLDLREKLNHPIYYPIEPQICLMSLFDVLKCAILEDSLIAFGNPAFDDEFRMPMTKDEVKKILVSWDSTNMIEDVNLPGTYISSPIKKEITSANIHRYWIKEDWFFDKQRSVLEARITGICPLAEKLSEDGELVGYKPLFWIYFPEARNYLVKAAVFNRHNDEERMNYDELFMKRMFSSYVYKESNVYDRSIAEYKTGLDALLESEKIKEGIFLWEDNLWHY